MASFCKNCEQFKKEIASLKRKLSEQKERATISTGKCVAMERNAKVAEHVLIECDETRWVLSSAVFRISG